MDLKCSVLQIWLTSQKPPVGSQKDPIGFMSEQESSGRNQTNKRYLPAVGPSWIILDLWLWYCNFLCWYLTFKLHKCASVEYSKNPAVCRSSVAFSGSGITVKKQKIEKKNTADCSRLVSLFLTLVVTSALWSYEFFLLPGWCGPTTTKAHSCTRSLWSAIHCQRIFLCVCVCVSLKTM